MRLPPSAIRLLLLLLVATACAFANRVVNHGAAAPSAPPLIDDFTRADQNPIAGNWESGLGSEGQVKIVANAAVNGTGSGRARVKPSAYAFSGNQRAEILWTSANFDTHAGPTLRNQASGAHYYVFFSYTYAQGAIGVSDGAGGNTELGARFYGYPVVGDTFGLEVSGSTITAYRISPSTGRTDLATRTDTTLTGGTPGFWVDASGSVTSFRGDNF